MQKRRENDSIENGYCFDKASSLLRGDGTDLTFGSPELAAKLAENDREKKDPLEVVYRFLSSLVLVSYCTFIVYFLVTGIS
jgi:hypothetical protein